MRFKTPTDALQYWFLILRNGGMPMSIYDIEESITTYTIFERKHGGRKAWVPSDSLCAYIDIGKAISRLSLRDQIIVKYYLLHIVLHDVRPDFRWKYRNLWPSIMRKLWKQIPQEYKQWT